MPLKEAVGMLSGALFFAAFVPYLWAIWQKNSIVKPSLATWLVWAVVDTIVMYGMYEAGSINYQIIGATAGAWAVFASAMIRGTSTWTKVDLATLAAAGVCIALWVVFDNPLIGIILGNIIIFTGGISTFISAWKEPENENALAWGMFTTSCIMAVYAIPEWTFADAMQPLTFLAVDGTVAFLVIVKPLFSRR